MTQLFLDASYQASDTLVCGLTPSGQFHVQCTSPAAAAPAACDAAQRATQRRIVDAFRSGRGYGVLQLGAGELESDLHPTLAYWREIGRTFVGRVCGTLDPMDPSDSTRKNSLADDNNNAAAAADLTPDLSADEIESFIQSVPPMRGAEFITPALLQALWNETGRALAHEAARFKTGVKGYLDQQSSVWNVVGRVCFHLAENKSDSDYPFAFMATYVHRVSKHAKPQHLPLGRALENYAGAKNRKKLLALLSPLSRAAEQSEFIRELVDSGDVYHPLRWTPGEAYRMLREVPGCEQAGLVVRLPDWWSATRHPRPKISVAVGGKAPSHLGMNALLDFDIALTLSGETLSPDEIAELLAASEGLVLIKGKWVEVDGQQLGQVLDHWHKIAEQAREEGVPFGEAMRMLAGISFEADRAKGTEEDPRPEWSEIVPGEWLSSALDALRAPELRAEIEANAGLNAILRPYQKLGVQWLWSLRELGLGGCLADDMGLGKTIQVLAVLAMGRRKDKNKASALLVVPASLVDNWRLEIERFAPELKLLIAHPSHIPTAKLKQLSAKEVAAHDAVITSYGTVVRTQWIQSYAWQSVILDEAQAIKNAAAKQTRAVKALHARWRLALTGTPVENSLGDLWSIMDFLNPGLLGSAKTFGRLCKSMASGQRFGYAPLRKLVQPYILRRLKSDKSIIADLPDKTEVNAYCPLSKEQAALYKQSVEQMKTILGKLEGIDRRGAVLAFLMRFKQICNHPSQWLGDGGYELEKSGKFLRLRELCQSIAARQDKVLVFTQFREMTVPLASLLAEVFGHSGLVLHGGTPVRKRQGLVQRFQQDELVPFMVLSLKAGGTGLNLTAASHVIHFDRWWNPAVENQATDRAFRIGQKKQVLVHKFICRGTVEEHIDDLITAKRELSDEILSGAGGGEAAMTELGNEELISLVSLDIHRALEP